MNIRRFISAYRWPLFLGGILGMSVVAQGVLVYVATRPDAPRPIANYYERGLEWEADATVLAASERLGWSVQLEIPAGEEFALGELRPVDIEIQDRNGAPVIGLSGKLVAIRPSDTRLGGESPLVEIPHEPGRYRTLARLPVAGLWELNLDAQRGEARFLYTERVTVAGGSAP